MTIFIPVLWVCINAHCEFMQAGTYFMSEFECRESIQAQKKHMRELASETEATVAVLEGTCVDAKIKQIRPPADA